MAIIGGNGMHGGISTGVYSAHPMGNTMQAAPQVRPELYSARPMQPQGAGIGFLPQMPQQPNVGFLPHMQQPMQLSGAPQQAAPSPWMQQAPWGQAQPWGQAPQWPQPQPWPQAQPFAGNRLAGLGASTSSAFGQPMNRLAGLPGNGGIY